MDYDEICDQDAFDARFERLREIFAGNPDYDDREMQRIARKGDRVKARAKVRPGGMHK